MAVFRIVVIRFNLEPIAIRLGGVGFRIPNMDSLHGSSESVIDIHARNASIEHHQSYARLMRHFDISAGLLIRIRWFCVRSV